MKNLINNHRELGKYKILAFIILVVTVTYILSDFMQWFINKDRFVLDLNQMPLYRRLLTDLYIVILGYGGYLLTIKYSKSWDIIILSLTGIIPSFIIILLVWNVSYYTSWIKDVRGCILNSVQ